MKWSYAKQKIELCDHPINQFKLVHVSVSACMALYTCKLSTSRLKVYEIEIVRVVLVYAWVYMHVVVND